MGACVSSKKPRSKMIDCIPSDFTEDEQNPTFNTLVKSFEGELSNIKVKNYP